MRVLRFGCLAAAAGLVLILDGCARQDRDEMAWARGALERNPDIEIVASDAQHRTFTVRTRDSGTLAIVRADQITAIAPPAAPAAGHSAVTTAAAAGPGRAAEGALPEPAAAAVAAPQGGVADLTHDRNPAAGKVLEKGPGYSIESANASGDATAARPAPRAVSSAAEERRHDPIVCQGARLLHIDNRNLVFDGDAVSAQDGCEIHITNSHISAAGVGILARAASVHIGNSQIEGDAGSIEASEGAQVFAESSRFRGLSRRLDSASVHDLGGNVWN